MDEINEISEIYFKIIFRGVKLIFTGGYISLVAAFEGPEVILQLYNCKLLN